MSIESLEILRSFLVTRMRRFNTRSQLEAWQNSRIEKFLHRTIAKSPFYRERFAFGSLDHANWRACPLMTRELFMENFQAINTRGVSLEEALSLCQSAERSRDFARTLGNLTVGMSSGTSGGSARRGVFLVSPRERALWSGNILAKTISGSLFAKCRIALFLRNNSNLYETVSGRHIQFRYFDLASDCEENAQNLSQFQPDILVAPPSMLTYLAELISVGRIKLRPAKVISVAEVLEQFDKELITSAFGTEPKQIYQCTEGFLAYTCEKGSMHLCEDLAVFERQYLVGEDGKFIPIVTDFTRTTQPVIRYWLGDILSDGATCDCASVYATIDRIVGRIEDCLLLAAIGSDKGGSEVNQVRILPDCISRIFSDLGNTVGIVKDYRVKQIASNKLVISLPEYLFSSAGQDQVAKGIERLCRSRGALLPTLVFEPLLLEGGFAVKRRRVQGSNYSFVASCLSESVQDANGALKSGGDRL
jgi:putative adenylate-forming enzyme